MTTENRLGTEKISKLLAEFSIPAIIGMIVNAIYNVIDRIYIGNAHELGGNGLAGITVGFPIMVIMLGLGILFGVGGATYFSIKLGEKKEEEATQILATTMAALIVVGIIITILGEIFLEPVLEMFGADQTIIGYSMDYMRIIFIGATFNILGFGVNSFVRADGQPRLAMITMFLGAGLNIVLDPIFIFIFKMGMQGAALATILSQIVSCIWVVYYFFKGDSVHRIKFSQIKLDFNILSKTTMLGMPGFLLQIGSSALNIILNKMLLIYGGNVAISGMGIVNSVQTLLIMPIIGLNQGTQPIISFNFGAKKYNRIKEVEGLAIKIATIIVIVGWIITRVFPEEIVGFFNREEELLKFGSYALKAWFLCLPVIGFQILAANLFQAIGKAKIAMLLTLSRQLLILMPAIVIFPKYWGINGLLHAGPFADGLSAIITGLFLLDEMKKMDRLEEQTENLNTN